MKMKDRFKKYTLWMLCMAISLLICNTAVIQAASDQTTASEETLTDDEQEDTIPEEQPEPETKKTTYNAVMRAGKEGTFHMNNPSGKVTWSVGNKKLLQVIKKSNKECKVKALKDGNTYIKASDKNNTYTYKVTIRTGDAYVKAWCKQWVKDYIPDDLNDKQKLIAASSYITIYGPFAYGSSSSTADVLTEGLGTCVSGGNLLVAMCEAMGFEARLRFAANDNMKRYPSGVILASQHYNVEVKINNKKYYIDGTPGVGFVYLSTAKKPIYYQIFDMVVPL